MSSNFDFYSSSSEKGSHKNRFAPLALEILLERGYCCGMGCQNCPYLPRNTYGAETISDFDLDDFSDFI